MAQIAFLLLCHKDPEAVIEQAGQLTAAGDAVAIHFDARGPLADFRRLREALAANPRVAFAARRLRCGWGEWSLVAATVLAAEAALAAFHEATHLYMVSGDCLPIKSAAHAHARLDAEDCDWIESVDFHEGGWIRTGLREERLLYRHWFNERASPRLFYRSLDLQRRLGLRRRVPADLAMMIGSQWWCLRRRTVEAVLAMAQARPDVLRFFRRTWIPDETFFQTLVRHLVPAREVRSRPLTFLLFTDYGMPVSFHDDHHDLLLGQEELFARKVSPEARGLRDRLGRLWASGRTDFAITGEGRRLFEYLTGRGREGRRFAPRAWEAEAGMGPGRELLVVACKKWHVAKRLVGSIKHHAGLPALDYVFNEEEAGLPDLGGLQATLAKRQRHRRALLRMLFDGHGAARLVICLDPADIHLLRDFAADRSTLRLLEVECLFTDAYLAGHARRVGLAGEGTAPEAIAALLPTLRRDVHHEAGRLRDARLPHHDRLSEAATPEENAEALARFLQVPPDVALGIARTPWLFAD